MGEYAKENKLLYPAMLKLQNKKCVIVGSGPVALRKLQTLGKAGALITVVAPDFSSEFREIATDYKAVLIQDLYKSEYVDRSFLTIAATNDFSVNRKITEDAPGLCNNITEPELGNFTVPASFQQGAITITVATDGVPAFTRLLKEQLQENISPIYGEFLEFLREQRQEVKTIPSTPQERTKFWRATLNNNLLKLLAQDNLSGAKEQVINAVTRFRIKS